MNLHNFSVLISFLLLLLVSTSASYDIQESFSKCITYSDKQFPYNSSILFTPKDSSFNTIYNSTVQNLRFLVPTFPRPLLIFTPLTESHVQSAVTCARKLGIQLRLRSGGHDYEGVSFTSPLKSSPPFILIDFVKLRAIDINLRDNTAWVQSGATLGQLYYRISQKSRTHGFPAGVYSSVGIGGHITGGAYGSMLRKYGLAADNAIDARIVNAKGEILDRKSMGEDLFWAIRGGGGGSFGIILAWKLRLVRVPSTVTVFTVPRTLEQGATKILYKWQQVTDKFDENLFLRLFLQLVNGTKNGTRTVETSYNGLYLGRVDNLLQIVGKEFPELGMTRNDCTEMSWIEAVVFLSSYPANTPPEQLLNPEPPSKIYVKAKSDYVKEPIPENVLEGMWKFLLAEPSPLLVWTPYGGKMGQIPEDAIPFPHRKGVIFMFQYLSIWQSDNENVRERFNWVNSLYNYMTPYVSKSPREAYLNYRDLDLGMNENSGKTSFKKASEWGYKYFKDNFKRLVAIKAKVDPDNFFWHEQSIPIVITSR